MLKKILLFQFIFFNIFSSEIKDIVVADNDKNQGESKVQREQINNQIIEKDCCDKCLDCIFPCGEGCLFCILCAWCYKKEANGKWKSTFDCICGCD